MVIVKKTGHLEYCTLVIQYGQEHKNEDDAILPNMDYHQPFDTTPITNTNCEPNTCGQPQLDPIWIQPSHNPWSTTSFDPALGLQDVLSLIPAQTIHHQTKDQLLEDFNLLVPLPDHYWYLYRIRMRLT